MHQEDDVTAAAPEITGTISEMNETGDSKLTWDKNKPAEVEAARTLFTTLRGRGYMAYSKRGENRELIRAFDPALEKIVMVPQTVGG
jgi:hypothetical protein